MTIADALVSDNTVFVLVVIERGRDHATGLDHAGRKEFKNQNALVLRYPFGSTVGTWTVSARIAVERAVSLPARNWRLTGPNRCLVEDKDGQVVNLTESGAVRIAGLATSRDKWMLSPDRKRLLICGRGEEETILINDSGEIQGISTVADVCGWLKNISREDSIGGTGWSDDGNMIYQAARDAEQLVVLTLNLKQSAPSNTVRTGLSALNGRIDAMYAENNRVFFVATDMGSGGQTHATVLDESGRNVRQIVVPGRPFAASRDTALVFWPDGAHILRRDHGKFQAKVWWVQQGRESTLAIDAEQFFRLFEGD